MYIYLDIFICRYLRSGPSQLILVLTLLAFIITLQIKKPVISTEEAKEEKKMMLAALPWSLTIVVVFIIVQTTFNKDQIGRFLLTSLLVSTVQQIIPLYFMLTLPKLKTFASESVNFFFTHNLIGKEIAFWNYVCCPGKFFTIQLKGSTKTNQVLPM